MMGAVFAEHRQTRPPAEVVERDRELWRRLDELGLVRLTGAEASGGSGAGWLEAAQLMAATVRSAVRIPLAEHDLLACWLLDANGMACDAAVRTVGLLDPAGVARKVPWAAGAERIVVLWHTDGQHRAADVDPRTLSITPGTNMINEPRDTVVADLTNLPGVPVSAELVDQLRLKSALVRSIQLCAALDAIVALSVDHATSRVQFGRPLSKFQAVQNQIADIAAESALARAATEAALRSAVTTDWSAPNLQFLVAVARSCAGHAASVVVRNAHQVHGAIGTTREHRLHEFTRAALAWRSEFGSAQYWDGRITAAAVQAGAAGLWGLITETPPTARGAGPA
ncbi:MAG: acyl-CoA dehydrogenase family protein [Mycobacteriaceae bacterium]|nr:acyl-CoA dehydrogenase family protein [Mycobacteriaceae bacterium]